MKSGTGFIFKAKHIHLLLVVLLLSPLAAAQIPVFKKHVIKPPRPTTKNNTVPSMVWVHDVDKDGKKDLIGQGYQPFHNGNKWYKCPDNPTRPWNEWHDYGVYLKNGHDIRLRDINGDGWMEVV